jgi:hypothetical protein
MSTAPSNDALKRRLDRYFWANNTGEMEFLRQVLKDKFIDFERVAVIGGLVRDFAHGGRRSFRSDLDLVIDAPKERIAEIASSLRATPNRFGGFGCKQGPWKIDFWALETTWARKYVPLNSLEDIVSSTFFDWDAVAYDLKERKLICSEDYLFRIRSRTLDVNLLPNPSPLGNLVRAVRRLMIWRVRAGPLLKSFIEQHLDDDALRYIQVKELELYPVAVSTRWATTADAKEALFGEHWDRTKAQFELRLD